ncbi:PGN_0703 family putative restriction endonuclease [Labedaea rhizosphaerae]|uniref:PD-(D/E)XK nuclease-like domain-containing protein n=1 Tax=Labedaea rhizosphaerae TaxID=598644 RepID=A0A4R6SL93_LABRH|nr:hypothetical protein [Labedaea rhizosphaerae]TDQ04968.1 hypothetical protein EV186_101932 [Labedaea rhizosphaerae]
MVRAANGLAEAERLWRNMLSSQPLAFSIVGELRAHERAALAVLGRLTGLELTAFDRLGAPGDPWALDGLQAEWAPPRDAHTGDKSGFDMAAVARTAAGERVLVTVEVKYVDTFSPAKLDPARYRLDGLTESDVAELVDLGASQFLRSVLLTESVRQHGLRDNGGLDKAVALVLCRADDAQARKVVDAVATACPNADLAVALRTHDELFDAADAQPDLREWARAMRRRYLTP